jgi:hypothetical protein
MDEESERCRLEIAAIEAELLADNPDVAGLCLALSDWSGELRILQNGTVTRSPDDQSSPKSRATGAGPHAVGRQS